MSDESTSLCSRSAKLSYAFNDGRETSPRFTIIRLRWLLVNCHFPKCCIRLFVLGTRSHVKSRCSSGDFVPVLSRLNARRCKSRRGLSREGRAFVWRRTRVCTERTGRASFADISKSWRRSPSNLLRYCNRKSATFNAINAIPCVPLPRVHFNRSSTAEIAHSKSPLKSPPWYGEIINASNSKRTAEFINSYEHIRRIRLRCPPLPSLAISAEYFPYRHGTSTLHLR